MIPKGIVARGVLLDAVRHRGNDVCIDATTRVTPEELDAIAEAQGVKIEAGDVVLVHTGFWGEFLRTGERSVPVAGVHWTCAEWLHAHDVAAIACENVAVEHLLEMDVEGMFLPFHALCLRDMGLILGEYWNMERPSRRTAPRTVCSEFQLYRSTIGFHRRGQLAGQSDRHQVTNDLTNTGKDIEDE